MDLTQLWVQHWRAAPDAVVVRTPSGEQALTGAQVEEATACIAAQLHQLGVSRGDRVLFSCSPSVETVLCYVAILRVGAVVVPANTGYTSRELGHVITDSLPVLAVIDSPARCAEHGLSAWTPASLVDRAREREFTSEPPLDEDRDGAAMIAYTSGTTGVPKGALLSRQNLLAGAQALVQAWEWTAQDVLIHALPMFHMHGLGAGLNGTFTAGASLIVMPGFDIEEIEAVLSQQNPTMFFGVPTMYARFTEHGALGHLSGLRLIVSGSAPLDPLLFQTIANEAGQSPVERYGMSETVMLTSNPIRGKRKPGSVGLPLPGVDIRLEEGNGVEVRGPNVFSGYWNRPDVDAFTHDGWFRTGDVGRFDEDGYLYLVGRASDLIITGGYNVYPREVEDVIRDIPGIADIAVVGIPDATWGERVVAFYVSHLPADVNEELARELLASKLATFKHPRRWVRMAELPRNAMGKVRRDVLREQG